MDKLSNASLDGVPHHPGIIREPVLTDLYGVRQSCVPLVCVSCGVRRLVAISVLRRNAAKNKFTGMCRSCCSASHVASDFDTAGVPNHPAIDRMPYVADLIGRKSVCLTVTCVKCGAKKPWPLSVLRRYKSNFHGMCRDCWRGGGMRRYMRQSKNPSGRRRTKSGYVVLQKNAIPDDDMDMFNAMRSGAAGFVAEHRWIMAKHLGRPLTTDETVHHRNGIKTDNRLENLELWVKTHPAGQRVEDHIQWATELLRKYQPSLLA